MEKVTLLTTRWLRGWYQCASQCPAKRVWLWSVQLFFTTFTRRQILWNLVIFRKWLLEKVGSDQLPFIVTYLVDKASVETCTKFTKCLMILYLYFSIALSTLTHKSRLPFGYADVGKDATAEECRRGAILPYYTEVDVLYTVKVTVSQPIFHTC